MILALDKHNALYIFNNIADAECTLEAIDVQDDRYDFCDVSGQPFIPVYIHPPKREYSIVDIGSFILRQNGAIDIELPERFIRQARYIEHSSIPSIKDIKTLLDELHKRA